MNRLHCSLAMLMLCSPALSVRADEPEQKPVEAAKPAEVKEVKIPGVLESAEMHEIILKPESWSSFKVEQAATHGQTIAKGSPLLKFESKDIDRKVEETQRSLRMAELSLELAKKEFETAQRLLPIDRKTAERSRDIAQQDLEYFENVSFPQSIKSTERSLNSAKYRLEYAQEELKQLEEMYLADDLTEKTEEIILTRARRDVEDAHYFYETAQIRTQRALEVELPRQREQLHTTTAKTLLETEKTLQTIDISAARKEHEFQQQQIAFDKSREEFAKLEQDRALMNIAAPAAGVVYHGQHTRGKWLAVSTLEKQLRPGGAVQPNQVLLTIVNPDTIFLRIDVPEDKLSTVAVGTKGHVVPTAFPDLKIEAEVAEISLAPIAPGTFDGRVTLKLENRPAQLMPGMACQFVVPEPPKK